VRVRATVLTFMPVFERPYGFTGSVKVKVDPLPT